MNLETAIFAVQHVKVTCVLEFERTSIQVHVRIQVDGASVELNGSRRTAASHDFLVSFLLEEELLSAWASLWSGHSVWMHFLEAFSFHLVLDTLYDFLGALLHSVEFLTDGFGGSDGVGLGLVTFDTFSHSGWSTFCPIHTNDLGAG